MAAAQPLLWLGIYRFPEVTDCIIHNDKLNCDFIFIKIMAKKNSYMNRIFTCVKS
jgi:hypothetical protein